MSRDVKMLASMKLLPGHSAVDGKVEGIEETNHSVNDKSNVAGEIIVQHDVEAEINVNIENLGNICELYLSERTWRRVMIMRGISVMRKRPMTAISIMVVILASLLCRIV